MKAPSDLFSQAYAPFLALGVGGLGGRAASAGSTNGFGERGPWAACDTDAPRLLSTGLEHKLLLPLPSGMPEHAALSAALAENNGAIQALAERRAFAIVFGALGETAAGQLMPSLCAELRRNGLFVCALGLEPFGFEGAVGAARAAGVAEQLATHADLYVPLPAQPIAAPLKASLSVDGFYHGAECVLLNAVEALLGALVGTPSAPAFNGQRIHSILRGAGRVSASVGVGRGAEAPRLALEDALDSRWTALQNLKGDSRLVLALVAGREISMSEAEEVSTRVRDIRLSDSPTLLGLGVETSLGDEARCLLLSKSGSQNVISLSSLVSNDLPCTR